MQSQSSDSYALSTTALLIANGDARDATEALSIAGIRMRRRIGFEDAAPEVDSPGLNLILIDGTGASEAALDAVLPRVDSAARTRQLGIVTICTPDQIDLVAAHLLGTHSQLLCAPAASELLGVLALARAETEARRSVVLHDVTRETETVRLRRLNEEVARIAETLARLTRGEDREASAGVRDPGTGYRGPESDTGTEASAQEIRAVIRSRRLRAQFFQNDLFADPAWDMLLDLFAARLERRQVSVSSLCIAAAVPPTTALRWIGTLHEAGLFERQADPGDRRRAYIGLSEKGHEGMHGYVRAARRAGLNLA